MHIICNASIVLQCWSPRHFHTFNVTSELFMSYHFIFDCQIIMEVISHLNNINFHFDVVWTSSMWVKSQSCRNTLCGYITACPYQNQVSHTPLPHLHVNFHGMNEQIFKPMSWQTLLGHHAWLDSMSRAVHDFRCSKFMLCGHATSFEVDVSVPQINTKSGFLLY